MLKMVTVFSRRPDMPADAFYDYWHNHHAALVREFEPTLRVRRYVQSPRIPSELMDHFVTDRGWIDDYDALTEVWFDSERDMLEAFGTPEGQAASRRLAEDEAVFIDMDRVVSFLSVEREVIGLHEFAEDGAPASTRHAEVVMGADQQLRQGNIALAERVIRTCGALRAEEVRDDFAEDAVLALPYAPSGTLREVAGRDAIIDYIGLLRDYIPAGIFREHRFDTLAADPNEVIARYSARTELLTTGRPYENTYVTLIQIGDGKVTRYTEYFDPINWIVAQGGKVERRAPARCGLRGYAPGVASAQRASLERDTAARRAGSEPAAGPAAA